MKINMISDYIHQIDIDYACCQLLCLLNTMIHQGKQEVPRPGSSVFEELVDLTGCRYGACISNGKAAVKYGYNRVLGEPTLAFLQQHLPNNPVELAVWTGATNWGFHSTLAVNIENEDMLTLVNYCKDEVMTKVRLSVLDTCSPPNFKAYAYLQS